MALGVILIGAAVLVIGAGSVSGLGRLELDNESALESDQIRLSLYRESLEEIQNRPLVGQGWQVARISHNTTLQLLISGGLIGLVAFGVAMFGYLVLDGGFGRHARSG